MGPRVTCIIPVFNGRRFLAEAIDSILAQTYRRIEVIVVDDGSTDRPEEIVAPYGPAVRIIRQENQGSAIARNCGIRAGRGEFFAFLDADDLWLPQKLERQMARFDARPELDLCATHIVNFWTAEVDAERRALGEHPRTGPVPGYVAGTLLVRRRLFERVGPFSDRLKHSDTMDFVLRARQHGAVEELLADVLVRRRMHAGNTSRTAATESWDEFLSVLKRSLDQRREKPSP